MLLVAPDVVEGVLVASATGLVALYDLRTGRVPNMVTLPLLALGLWQHWPGTVEVWVLCLLLYAGWHAGGVGGGDVKLWWALFWLTPPAWIQVAPFVFGAIMVVTAGAQILVRRRRSDSAEGHGRKAPAAWRAVPYAVWLGLLIS